MPNNSGNPHFDIIFHFDDLMTQNSIGEIGIALENKQDNKKECYKIK